LTLCQDSGNAFLLGAKRMKIAKAMFFWIILEEAAFLNP